MAQQTHREDEKLLQVEGEILGMLSPLPLLERSIEKTCVSIIQALECYGISEGAHRSCDSTGSRHPRERSEASSS